MRERPQPHKPTPRENLANLLVLAAGALLAAGGLVYLVILASSTGGVAAVAASVAYGVAVVTSFLFAVLYHVAERRVSKAVYRALDHCAIFTLIAGTYTPITLLALPRPLGWTLFGVVWGLAVVGIALRLWFGRMHWVLIPVFLVMGWLGALWSGRVVEHLGATAAALVLAGGVAYTSGLAIFLFKRLPYHVVLWHLFVIVGAVCHFLAVALYVVPE